MVIRYELDKNAIKTGDFCNSMDFLKTHDPRLVFNSTEEEYQSYINDKIDEYEAFDLFFAKHDLQYPARRVDGLELFDQFWMKLNQTSAIVHYFSSWTSYQDFCKEKHSTIPEGKSVLFYENCALAHINYANSKIIEGYPHRIFRDFEDMDLS